MIYMGLKEEKLKFYVDCLEIAVNISHANFKSSIFLNFRSFEKNKIYLDVASGCNRN